MRHYFFLVLVFASWSLVAQKTIEVPADYETIQEALDAAVEFDTVLVSPGTYYENIIWPDGKNLQLIGLDGSEFTTIDGSKNGKVIQIQDLNSQSNLSGFTIRNGYLNSAPTGLGLEVFKSNITLKDLIIKENIGFGCGASLVRYNGKIDQCIFSNNSNESRLNQVGAGLFLMPNGATEITNCEFSENSALGSGGGMLIKGLDNNSTVLVGINKCTFANNISIGDSTTVSISDGGGGLSAKGLNGHLLLRVDSSNFSNNLAIEGGAIKIDVNVDSNISNCFFRNNKALRGDFLYIGGLGFGFAANLSTQYVSNCKINYNGNDNSEGLIYAYFRANLQMLNCEIGYNDAIPLRASFSDFSTNNLLLQNCTVANNKSPIELDEAVLDIRESILWNKGTSEINTFGSRANISNSIIKGGYEGTNVIDSDPLFLSEDNLIPSNNSLAINAGIPSFTFDTDLLGNPRPLPAGTNPDLGCYEVDQSLSSTSQNEKLNKILIYPNPTSSQINFSEVIDDVELYDNNGRLVKSSSKSSVMNVQSLPEGIYMIHLSKDGLTHEEKIIITR